MEFDMSILTADNLGVSFGAFDLFRGISVSIPNDGKIGLIGPNGIGKTTLLLILAGINPPTTGKVHIARGRRIGYLRQEAVEAFGDRENTVYNEMLSVFSDLLACQDRLNEMEARLASEDYSEELLAQYGEMQETFERDGGYEYDIRIQQTLDGLGLGKTHWNMPLNHLSGGQKTRALLARLLLEKPDLLMLDEPTNHLDIEAVEWLEHVLGGWDGAVLIVSHDRFFLDNTVNTVWDMTRSGIETYSGNYSSYLTQRQARWEYYERVYSEEKARLVNTVDFIQRNWVRASTHARALGLLRRLTRELAIVENYGIMALRSGKKWSEYDRDTIQGTDRPLDVIDAIRKVNAITMVGNRPLAIHPRLNMPNTSGTMVLRAQAISVGYPGNHLFDVKDLELRRGESAALIGPNGSGKTTFLKVLLGQLEPTHGQVQLGASLKIGYFAQAQDALKGESTVFDEIQRHKEMDAEVARNHLAQYLFRGEDVFKPLDALSGGERARLALAILSLEGYNLLLLDEPTNHLDISAREALQDVLDGYPGTILLVSHDRYLIDQLATQVWEIRERKLVVFKGKYREYVLRREASATSPDRKILLAPKPLVRDNSKETRRRTEALTQLEERIRDQEHNIQRLSSEMQKAGKNQAFERVNMLSNQVAIAQARLEEYLGEWERLVT
jgi:ATP-binding cassette, subfamily F, member 3